MITDTEGPATILTFSRYIASEALRPKFTVSRRPRSTSKPIKTSSRFFTTLGKYVSQTVTTRKYPDLETLEIELDEFLEQELETTTWSSYAQTWNEFETFCQHAGQQVSDRMGALWLLSLLRDHERDLSVQGIYQMSKKLTAVASRLPEADTWVGNKVTAFKAVLVKMGARIPIKQACPIKKDQVYCAFTNPTLPTEFRFNLLLMWKSASRADDLQSLDTEAITFTEWEGRPMIVLRWIPHLTKGRTVIGRLKNDTTGLGKSCVVDAGEMHDVLAKEILSRKRRKGPFMLDNTETFVRKLKKYVDKNLTGHSLKRGALEHVLRQENIPLNVITELGRHATPLSVLPPITRLYLPPIELALRLGTQVATRTL
jgi:hypothetical protein